MLYAKAIAAAITAGLTAASAIYVDNAWLTIALAVVTTITVYLVPNKDMADTPPAEPDHLRPSL